MYEAPTLIIKDREADKIKPCIHNVFFKLTKLLDIDLKWSAQQSIKETVKKSAHYIKTSKQHQILPGL